VLEVQLSASLAGHVPWIDLPADMMDRMDRDGRREESDRSGRVREGE
jgi:hypothetical protein